MVQEWIQNYLKGGTWVLDIYLIIYSFMLMVLLFELEIEISNFFRDILVIVLFVIL